MLYSLLPQALISQPIIFNLFEKIKAIGIHSSSVTLCGRQLFFPDFIEIFAHKCLCYHLMTRIELIMKSNSVRNKIAKSNQRSLKAT